LVVLSSGVSEVCGGSLDGTSGVTSDATRDVTDSVTDSGCRISHGRGTIGGGGIVNSVNVSLL